MLRTTLPLIVAYTAMVAVQSHGAALIGLLWGPAAAQAATETPTDAVQPDLPLAALCAGNDAAHFDTWSNILHAAGMLTTLLVFGLGVVSVAAARPLVESLRLAAWLPPSYYIPAWIGHIGIQGDVPAVFTYGTTLRGWASGEYCAWRDLAQGGTVAQPWEVALAVALTLVWTQGILRAIPSTLTPPTVAKPASVKKD
jgi:hypothetical protein